MALILNIDTAIQDASICLAIDDSPIGLLSNSSQKDHASWLLLAVRDLLAEKNLLLSDLSAVAVTSGPGSYTGLRVGLATAKGLCYALKIPLIAINTLEMMAVAAKEEETDLLCPMIDARRMEVFTALYNRSLTTILAPNNKILDPDSFLDYLKNKTITFFGNGSPKFEQIVSHPNARFRSIQVSAKHMIILSYSKFQQGETANLAYAEPEYGKEFYSPPVKQSI